MDRKSGGFGDCLQQESCKKTQQRALDHHFSSDLTKQNEFSMKNKRKEKRVFSHLKNFGIYFIFNYSKYIKHGLTPISFKGLNTNKILHGCKC